MTDDDPAAGGGAGAGESPGRGAVRTGTDPTEAVLSESALRGKCLCDYNTNVAFGCAHGCRFCYVPSTPQTRTRGDVLAERADVDDPREEWGEYLLRRPGTMAHDLARRLANKRTWRETPGGQGIVGMSFHTDAYQDLETARTATACLWVCAEATRPDGGPVPVRVLTRNPRLAATGRFEGGAPFARAFEAAGDAVTVGASIPSWDAARVRAVEPAAPPPAARLAGLEALSDAGVTTYVSMSPTYPTQTGPAVRAHLRRLADRARPDVVFHEPINPRGGNIAACVRAARDAGADDLAAALEAIRGDEDAWLRYAFAHLMRVQRAAEAVGVDVHLWPDAALESASEQCAWATREHDEWAAAWRRRQSPEDFAGRPDPDDPPPALPPDPPAPDADDPVATGQRSLDEF